MYQSLRRPPDSRAISETPPLAPVMEPRGTLFRVAGRLVMVISVAAITAQFFYIVMPPVRQRDSTQLFATAVQSFTTAVSQQHQSEGAPIPALAGFQSLLVSDDIAKATEREQLERESDAALQQFLQWRQRANLSEAAR